MDQSKVVWNTLLQDVDWLEIISAFGTGAYNVSTLWQRVWLHEFSRYMQNRAERPCTKLSFIQYNNNLVTMKCAHSSSILPILIYKINEVANIRL